MVRRSTDVGHHGGGDTHILVQEVEYIMDGAGLDEVVQGLARTVLERFCDDVDYDEVTSLAAKLTPDASAEDIAAALVVCFERDIREWFGTEIAEREGDPDVQAVALDVAAGKHLGAVELFAEQVAEHSGDGDLISRIRTLFVGDVRQGKYSN